MTAKAKLHNNPFTAELVIKPARSRLLLIFIGCTHLCAAGVLSTVPGLDLFWRLMLLAIVALSAAYFLLLHSNFWAAKTVQTLYWREFGGWELVDGRGQQLPVILLDSSFSSLYCSVLNFKTRRALGYRRYTVILLVDSCSPEIQRSLRMRMKLYIANK